MQAIIRPDKLDLGHVERLTNDVGITQHARYDVPDYRHGYCVDDNARALMLAAMAYRQHPRKRYIRLIHQYLAFLNYMHIGQGQFRNFLSYDLRFLDEVGTEDSHGRAVWALGYFSTFKKTPQLRGAIQLSEELFRQALPQSLALRSVRAVAYSMLGAVHYMEAHPSAELREQIHRLADFIVAEFQASQRSDWCWYEEVLTYDNAIIPYSLLRCSEILGKSHPALGIAWQTAKFLGELLFADGSLSLIGNQGWYARQGKRAPYGQQPLEIPSLIWLYRRQFELTGAEEFLQRADQAFRWLLGENERGLPLYDSHTKGCRDGLEREGINQNQGAESTISFWLAYLANFQGRLSSSSSSKSRSGTVA